MFRRPRATDLSKPSPHAPPSPNIAPNSHSMPIWACFGCSARPLPFPFTITAPQGCVFRVWHVTHIPPRLEQQNEPTRAHSVVRVPSPRLEHQNTLTRVCSDVRACPLLSRTAERAHTGSFCCSGTSSPHLEQQNEPTWARSAIRARSPCLKHQNEPRGSFCCSGTFPPRLEQQNEPLWARSDVQARFLSLPLSQTSERALVGAFLCLVMSPSSPTGKTCLIGRVFAVRHTHTLLCFSACPYPSPYLELRSAQIGNYFYNSVISSFVFTFYIKIKIIGLIFL